MYLRINIEFFDYPGGNRALSGIDLEIEKGEFIGVLGANGSGKTTLVKIIDGLIKDFRGDVCISGASVKKLTPREIYSKMGLVFQNPDDQLFAATVFEDVAFGPINMGFGAGEVERRVQNALAEVGLVGFEKRAIHSLSFGQKKRACIAGLLAMGHEMLLLDEPTSGLDPLGASSIMRLLENLNKDKKITVIMTTHSVDLIPLFINRAVVLKNGTIVLMGAPDVVFSEIQQIRDAELRLPRVAHLFEILKKKDGIKIDSLPLTIGEAREKLKQVLK